MPEYFYESITEANKEMKKERELYEIEKKHIVLNIEGKDHRMRTDMLMTEFRKQFVEKDKFLILESEYNGLPLLSNANKQSS